MRAARKESVKYYTQSEMSVLQRAKSDWEALAEAAEVLLPYLLQEVDVDEEEEERKVAERGASSAEFEVEYKGLRCSGLRLSYNKKEKKADFFQRVVDVCDILGHFRHPNVLQFIGVSYDPRTCSPPLIVSELLSISLSACIDRHGVLPGEIGYTISRDIALGLRYLHEQHPSFVHGDLTAHCILLAGDFTAKIARVGVARLSFHNDGVHQYHLPPEARGHHAKTFDRKVDIFSFGIILLHIFVGRTPIPKKIEQLLTVIEEEGSPAPPPSPCRTPSQLELFEDYVNELGSTHPITDTITSCLKDQPILRPEISEISPNLRKQAASHRNLFRKGSAHQDILHNLKKERKRKFCKFFTQVSTSDSAYGSVSEAEIEELQLRCRRLSVQNESLRRLSLTPEHLVKHLTNFCSSSLLTQPLTPDKVKLNWEQCSDLPVSMFRASAITLCGRVYVGGGITEHELSDFYVLEFNPSEDKWDLLPPLPVKLFGLGKMSQDLVVVGGQVHNDELSDKVYTFDQYNQLWKESSANLNTPRFLLSVIETETCLVAMGGIGRDSRGDLIILSSIEVYCINSNSWKVKGDLPIKAAICSPSLAIDAGTLYLVGGYRTQTAISATPNVHSSSISSLTCDSLQATKSWKALPQTPHLQSTALVLNGCLLALGGSDSPYSSSVNTSIHAFDTDTDEWKRVCELPYASCHPTAIPLTHNEILVIGGWVKPGARKASRSVYRGRLPNHQTTTRRRTTTTTTGEVVYSDTEDLTDDYITLPAITITPQ